MSVTVSSMLAHKGGEVITIAPGVTVFEAIGRMVEHNVGAIVISDGDDVQGIFTERDYLRRIALQGRTSRETRIEDAMTTDLTTVTPEATVDGCLAMMTDGKFRHLPVLHAGRLVGVISIGDCVRAMADEAQGEAEELKRFVTGGYTG